MVKNAGKDIEENSVLMHSAAEGRKIMGRLKFAILVLCNVLLLTACFGIGYHFGFKSGYEAGWGDGRSSGYSVGYTSGYALGNQTGFETGYAAGFSLGNETGYSAGYNIGYIVGYKVGYEEGEQDGYGQGYLIGFKHGNSTGYDIGYEFGYEDGYVQGVADGAGRGYTMRDPAYSEALRFMRTDQTDKHRYMNNYTCLNFAADFKKNALETGYRCGLVYLKFPMGAHALVCFNTTDMGMVFIEPQFDMIMRVEVGIRYWVDNGFQCSEYDDTIVDYVVIW
jgi:hypothetical protein